MDLLTQIVLGGAVGEAVLGKKIGNKAILWGAIGGTIPDLDTIPGQFLDTVNRLEIHRGFSHSIIFAILISPLLAWLVSKIYKKNIASFWEWTKLFFWSIFTHPLLDIFTTWGTQLFWPSEWRIAIQSVFVIDPFYTLPFLLVLIGVLFLKRNSKRRVIINRIGILLSSSYLLWSLISKSIADSIFKNFLEKQEIEYIQFESRPAPFSTILWTANIETKNMFYITYYSLLDDSKELKLRGIEKNHKLLYPYRNNKKLERLIKLTKGYYTIESSEKGLIINDLRFGLTNGFMDEMGEFVFRYEVIKNSDGIQIEQMPNDLKAMRDLMPLLYERILGTKPS